MNSSRSLLVAAGLLGLSVSLGSAAEPSDKEVSYYKDVRRIFQQHCQGCHQPAKPQGGYVMT
ncbi:MAG TPA: cytochrome c, partial [Gemmataceae bacterium]|nr:cytochrome c [Gemmataceae bacterium]